MKGKRLLIVGAAVALAISGCASATRLTRTNPFNAAGDSVTGNWTPITSVDDINENDDFLLAYSGSASTYYASGTVNSNYLIVKNSLANAKAVQFVVATGGYYIKISSTEYLNNTSSTNVAASTTATSIWAINSSDFCVENTTFNNRFLGGSRDGGDIKAYAASNKGSYPNVHVYKKAISLTLDKTELVLVAGSTATLVATLDPENAGTITWSSSNNSVATVDDGLVTAVAAGSATITAKISETIKATCSIVVNSGAVHATGIELDKNSGSLIAGQSISLTASVEPSNSTDEVTWSSSNNSVATVDDGLVTAVAAGSATITASVNGHNATFALNVDALTAVNNYDGALVNNVGKIMFKNGKTALIDDGTGAFWAYATENVTQDVGDLVRVQGTSINYNNRGGLEVSDATLTTVTDGSVVPSSVQNIDEEEIINYIDDFNANIANTVPHKRVSMQTGIIGGSGNFLTWTWPNGTANLETNISTGDMEVGFEYNIEGYLINFYLSGGKTYLCVCVLVANKVAIEPTEISLDQSELNLEVDETARLEATFGPAGSSGAIDWISNDSSVATVEGNGNVAIVTAVGAGSTTIVAHYSDDVEAICDVVVNELDPSNLKAILKYTGSETGNMTETGNAENVGLDANLFSVDADKGETTLLPGLNKAGDIRLYSIKSAAALGKGSSFTVRVVSTYIIKSIKIDFKQAASDAKVFAGTSIVSGDDDNIYEINGSLFTIQNGYVSDGSANSQVIINKVEIYYRTSTASEAITGSQTSASLSFNYSLQQTPSSATDTLNRALTGVTSGSTSYSSWSNKASVSSAVYAGNSAGGNDSIQLRSNNNTSGIVTTASGGKATKITVEWQSSTANSRQIDIYGKATAYSAASDLYGNDSGDLIGSIGRNETELTIDEDYEFIGIRSNEGALYLKSVEIEWSGSTISTYTYSNVAIRFGASIDPATWNALDEGESKIAGYGVTFGTTQNLANPALNVETARGFYKPVSAKVDGHPDLVGENYVWNLYLRISTTIDGNYSEDYLDDEITAVAYIKLENGDIIFLQETTASVNGLADELVKKGTYSGDVLASLSYLASL